MKYLNQFLKFDALSFFKGKTLVAVETAPWYDFETKNLMGTKVVVVIFKDHTKYNRKQGENHTNQFEKLNVKVPKADLKVPSGAVVELMDAVATVYGEYRNQLSVTANDIRVVSANQGGMMQKEG